jgi:multiple sugar transport system substrate-binding protein
MATPGESVNSCLTPGQHRETIARDHVRFCLMVSSRHPRRRSNMPTPRRSHASLVGLAVAAIIFSACSGSSTPAPASAAAASAAGSAAALPPASGATTLGSNESDANPKAAVAALADYCSKQSGITIKINTTDHNTFQNQISSYLQGKPDDVVKWFAGNRLRFFAAQNLLTPIDDVWAQIGSNYTDAFKTAATGADGHQYLVPSINYPWVVMYRKSLFTAKGYTVPTTLDQFVTLAKKMQTDGLVPLAYGDKDGRRWAPSTSSTCG